MNKETLQGDWNVLKGKIKEKWGKLTDDDISFINGKKDQLLGVLQRKYGLAKEKAEQELSAWEKTCSTCSKEDASEKAHSYSGKEHGSQHEPHGKNPNRKF